MSVLNCVSHVTSYHMCLTCLRALRAHMPYVPSCLRAFTSYVSSFFCMPYVPSVFYVHYLPSLFTYFTCPHFFKCLHFLRAYVPSFFYAPPFFTCLHFIYIYANKALQFNELTYDCSPLLFLNSVIYQRLSSIFTSVELLHDFSGNVKTPYNKA